MPEQVQRCRRQLTAQQKDERQDNRDRSSLVPRLFLVGGLRNWRGRVWEPNYDRRRLASQHPSNLLCSLTHGRDAWWRTVRRHLDCASSFAILNFPRIWREVKGQRCYLTDPEGMQNTTANKRTHTNGKIHT